MKSRDMHAWQDKMTKGLIVHAVCLFGHSMYSQLSVKKMRYSFFCQILAFSSQPPIQTQSQTQTTSAFDAG
jgi:hypothetical protein